MKTNNLGIKLFYFTVLIGSVVGILYSVKILLIPILAAFLLAMILQPIVSFFEVHGFRQLHIISGIYLAVFSFMITLFAFITPMFIEDMKHLTSSLPQYLDNFKAFLGGIQSSLQEQFPFIEIPSIESFSQAQLIEQIGGASNYLSSSLSNIITLFTFSLIVPFISFFILKDSHLMKRELLKFVPNKYFEMFVLLFHKIGSSLQLYIRGQMIDAAYVGTATAIGLSIIGFPFALVIGMIAGIGNFIPYLGPILGAIPAITIIIVTPEWMDISSIMLVVSVFLIVQMSETLFVYPLAVGNSVNLHPLIIILAILVGGELGGILGMILVIPIVAITKVTFSVLHKYMYDYKILG